VAGETFDIGRRRRPGIAAIDRGRAGLEIEIVIQAAVAERTVDLGVAENVVGAGGVYPEST
jgi:hypothetical protein